MKSILLLIIFFFVIFKISAQISPAFKFGIGYPYFSYNDLSISPDKHTLTGYPTVSVEKPIPIEIRLKKRLSINPGVAYYYFTEHELKGDKTEGKDFNFGHQTLNGYVKILYQAKFRGKTEAFIWAGGIGGFHVATKTKGEKIVYGLNQEIPEYLVDINENGKDFFEMLYYGMVAGFQPNARKYNFIKPSFEVMWLPGFATLREPNPVDEDNPLAHFSFNEIGIIQFSVFLGFRIR